MRRPRDIDGQALFITAICTLFLGLMLARMFGWY